MGPYIDELVSVIIPCYNSKHTIEKTIKSVLNQTYLNFEIVLVDDCSTDDSRQLLAQYEEQYQQVKFVLLKENSGAAVARNEGLKVAKGQYIAFLDSDDTWVPEKLEKQVDFMKKKQVAFSYTSYDVIDVNNQRIKKPLKIKERATYKTLLKKTLIATPTAMIDRNMTGEVYMPLKRTGQDYAFWLLLLGYGRSLDTCVSQKQFVIQE